MSKFKRLIRRSSQHSDANWGNDFKDTKAKEAVGQTPKRYKYNPPLIFVFSKITVMKDARSGEVIKKWYSPEHKGPPETLTAPGYWEILKGQAKPNDTLIHGAFDNSE